MKKGLRQITSAIDCKITYPLNYCPDEEGIKTSPVPMISRSVPLNYCPDEEGIKTYLQLIPMKNDFSLNYCPDEEGIKTRALPP